MLKLTHQKKNNHENLLWLENDICCMDLMRTTELIAF